MKPAPKKLALRRVPIPGRRTPAVGHLVKLARIARGLPRKRE